jgi:hypothetical protein
MRMRTEPKTKKGKFRAYFLAQTLHSPKTAKNAFFSRPHAIPSVAPKGGYVVGVPKDRIRMR